MFQNSRLIVYIGPFRFPNHDAAAIRVINNIKIFSELSYDVLVLSWGGSYNEEDLCEDGNYYYNGIRYVITEDIDINRKNIFERFFYLFFTGQKSIRYLKKTFFRDPIIVAYNTPLYFTIRLILFNFRYKVHLISDITEWYNGDMFPGGKYFFPAIFNEFNMFFTQKFVKNKIIVSSYLNKFYQNSNNMIIPPLIDVSEEKWLKNVNNYNQLDGFNFLYVGTPASPNDIKDNLENIIDNLLSFIENGYEIKLNIVGVSYSDILHYKNYEKVITQKDKILLHGRVSNSIVPVFFANSDFSIVYRSNTRKSMAGFPSKLPESLASSCPVITSNISDVSDFIIDEYNGFVIDGDLKSDFDKVIFRIVNMSRVEIDIMKKNAYDTALNKFNYLVYKSKLNNYLNRIII